MPRERHWHCKLRMFRTWVLCGRSWGHGHTPAPHTTWRDAGACHLVRGTTRTPTLSRIRPRRERVRRCTQGGSIVHTRDTGACLGCPPLAPLRSPLPPDTMEVWAALPLRTQWLHKLICVINFKPKLLSHRLHRSTPDVVWLNPKSRFKLIPELIASRAPKCIKSLRIRRSDRSKMTERFLEKQTAKLISKINRRLQPMRAINFGN